jgi:hypothetical protein
MLSALSELPNYGETRVSWGIVLAHRHFLTETFLEFYTEIEWFIFPFPQIGHFTMTNLTSYRSDVPSIYHRDN